MNHELNTLMDALGDPRDIDDVLDRRVSRREAVAGSGKLGAAIALGAMPFALAAMARQAFGQGTGTLPAAVIDVLNFALTLEMLEAEFYNRGVDSGIIGPNELPVFLQIQKHENDHVAVLKATLRSSAIGQLKFDYTAGGTLPNPFKDYPTFFLLSQAFEDTGVRAYKGQAPNLKPYDDYLTVALRIHSVEARHAAEVRRLRSDKAGIPTLKAWITRDDPTAPAAIKAVYAGEANTMQLGIDVSKYLGVDPATEAFDEPLTRAQVEAIVKPFIVGPA